MAYRASRRVHSPRCTLADVEQGIEALRRAGKPGSVAIAGRLGGEGVTIVASTVHRVLIRRSICRLRDLQISRAEVRL